MKKFYFLMVALCVAMAANAASSQLFLVGDPAGGWATNKGLEMTKTGEGVFEIKGEFGGTFAFSDILCASNNDWSTFNAHRYGAESKDMAVEPGKYKANYGWDNSWQIVKAEYTFTVDTNNGELTISTEQEIVKNVSYAIHGTILGDADWTSYDMTEDNGLWVLADVNLKEGDFGIKENTNGSQSAWYASSDNTTVGAEGEYGAKIGGTNWHSTLEGAYTLTFDPVACKLTISSGTLKPRSIYLIGNIEGANWTTNQGGVLTEVEAGSNLYMGTVKMADSGNDYSYFNITTKLTVDNGDWDGLNAMGCRYMAPSEDADLQSNTVAEFIDGTDKGWSFKIIPGTHTFVINLDAKTIVFYTVSDLIPSAMHMYGNFGDVHFDWSKPLVAEATGDYNNPIFEFTGVFIDEAVKGSGKGYFTLAAPAVHDNARMAAPVHPDNADWSDLNANYHRYSADSANGILTAHIAGVDASKAKVIEVEAPKAYDVTVRMNSGGEHEITTTYNEEVTTGVEAIDASETAEAEYYSLQGVRIARPERGICIVKKGAVAKVVKF